MDKKKKQGFFSALKEEVARGLSPARSRPRSPGKAAASGSAALCVIPRRRKGARGRSRSPEQPPPRQPATTKTMARSGSLRRAGEALAPLVEGPDGDACGGGGGEGGGRGGAGGSEVFSWGARLHSPPPPPPRAAEEGAPPVSGDPLPPRLCVQDASIERSSAQYILQQYTSASGGLKLLRSVRSAYAMGKLQMVASEFQQPAAAKSCGGIGGSSRAAAAPTAVASGGFVLWQMAPDMWYVELAVGGCKARAGSDGRLVWRHTPWLGVHAARGPVRPLRRALQGLDPLTTANMFAGARCIGENRIDGEDCFILKLSADPETLKARSEGPAEIIRHVLFGYFSHRTGLLIHVEDSHLTRIQSNTCADAVYWETTISSSLNDYRLVDGIMIAHSGRSAVTLFRFGEAAASHTKTRMEEVWTVDEVAFNIPGLSTDCFIPPADINIGSVGDSCEQQLSQGVRPRSGATGRAKVFAAADKLQD
uniref:DUF620 domain-containing protein n=1 Tax=Ananas comosus var. bracteatus TaxID=296719 RepID=A0A6V7Q4P4_ANACO|nr:unnamed protein product [Ananas comosus var. bracteatus]